MPDGLRLTALLSLCFIILALAVADLFVFGAMPLLCCQLDWAVFTGMAGLAAVHADLAHLCLLPAGFNTDQYLLMICL